MTNIETKSEPTVAHETVQLELPLRYKLETLDRTANLSAPHRPRIEDEPYYQRTSHHFYASMKLTPCADLLWDWILLKAPAGTLIECDLKDFQAITSEHRRGRAYSMKSIRNALSELEGLGLVVVKRERVSLLGCHPGPVANLQRKAANNAGRKLPNREINFQTGKLISTDGKLISTRKAETTAVQEFQSPTDLTDLYRSSSDHDADAGREILSGSKVEQLVSGINQGKDDVSAGTNRLSNETKGEISNQDSSTTSKDKFSAVQLESLKTLGIILSQAARRQMDAASAEEVDLAITCFKQDKREWTGGEMKNPTGYFISVFRQVKEGRRPVQQLETEVDPLEQDLEMWQRRWHNLPQNRQQFCMEIQKHFPRGEIIILDWETGPIRGGNSAFR